MIGEFVTASLLLVLGYAYPAFQCFKTVEKNRAENAELRFWCQYWIIVAVITVFERVGDIFISWLPMYGEMKLALFIYLWYPKTKGTGYVYETLVRPYASKHETGIEQSLLEFRERAWNLAIYYWHNCTELSSTKILQFLQFMSTQSETTTQPPILDQSFSFDIDENQRAYGASPPPPPTSTSSGIFRRNRSDKRGSSGSSTSYFYQTPNSESIQVHLNSQTHYIRPEDVLLSHADIGDGLGQKSGTEHAARHRLWRFLGRN